MKVLSHKPSWLIFGANVLDIDGFKEVDFIVQDDQIVQVGKMSLFNQTLVEVSTKIDATGCIVFPGLVDPHTHLRVPGGEEAETFISGTKAGAAGGYCALLAMPNTEPAVDLPARVLWLKQMTQELPIDVLSSAAITKNRAGEELVPFASLKDVGVKVFTDDGQGVQNPRLMLRALQYSNELNLLLAQHCETEELFNGGIMNEGSVSERLGISSIPAAAEETMVARDIELARSVGAPIHFLHLSTTRSADLVARAKRDGLKVTAEVTPHHLYLDDSRLEGFDARYKVNPPLRTKQDVAWLWEHLSDGTFDVIGTDHAPHPSWKKDTTLDQAAFGMLGLQHALVVLFTGAKIAQSYGIAPNCLPPGIDVTIDNLNSPAEEKGLLRWLWLIVSMMSWKPSRLIGYPTGSSGSLQTGSFATFVIFDPKAFTQATYAKLYSKATNSPYIGETFNGEVRDLFVKGRHLVKNGRVIEEKNWC